MTERLRLLLATPRFAPQRGGAETWTREIAGGLARRGHRVLVLARAAPGVEQGSSVQGVEVRRSAGSRLGFAADVARAVREERPDVVLGQYSALSPAAIAARRSGLASVGIVHDVYGLAASIRLRGPLVGIVRWTALERSMALARPDAFLVPSRVTARNLQRLAGGRPITVVPTGMDHLAAGPRTDHSTDPTQVVFVGRLVRQKGVDDLIAAVRMLSAGGTEVHAVVVGSGPEEERLRRIARAAPVRFAGALDDATLDGLIRGSAILVLPSLREGWGLAVSEAAARGIPYVAYDIPAIREQHEELQGGLLVPSGPDALAGALASLLADPDLRRSLGARGRTAAQARSWTGAAEVVEGALAAVVARRR
jgi:glycosyltransferase involved in cell wall biosynthesis